MTTAVKLQSGLQSDLSLDISTLAKLGQRLFSRIEAVDVGLVMLGVVECHDLLRDGGFESLSMISAFP